MPSSLKGSQAGIEFYPIAMIQPPRIVAEVVRLWTNLRGLRFLELRPDSYESGYVKRILASPFGSRSRQTLDELTWATFSRAMSRFLRIRLRKTYFSLALR